MQISAARNFILEFYERLYVQKNALTQHGECKSQRAGLYIRLHNHLNLKLGFVPA